MKKLLFTLAAIVLLSGVVTFKTYSIDLPAVELNCYQTRVSVQAWGIPMYTVLTTTCDNGTEYTDILLFE